MRHKHYAYAVIMLLALVVSLYTGCGWEAGAGYKYFDYNLRGSWKATEWGGGTLVITMDTITINDSVYPFDGKFTKTIALEGYSEEISTEAKVTKGYLYINDRGVWREGVPYTLWLDGNNNMVLTVGSDQLEETMTRVKAAD